MRHLHGLSRVNGKKTKAYRVWECMRFRCNNTRCRSYKNYGARGIRVCSRWDDFALFLADMGEPPVGMTLDRIDNDGNYEPENCRWATPAQQARNSRKAKLSEAAVWCIRSAHASGISQTDLGTIYGVSQQVVSEIVLGRSWI